MAGVPSGDKVELRVRRPGSDTETVVGTYRMAEKIGFMALAKFAHVSTQGVQAEDARGLAVMYDLFRGSIHPEDWDRFEVDALESSADAAELMQVVREVIERVSANPTGSRSGSSAGPRPTSPSSKASSSIAGTEDLTSVGDLMGPST